MKGEDIKNVICSPNRGYMARLQALVDAGGLHFEHRLTRARRAENFGAAVDAADSEAADDEDCHDSDIE